MLAQPSARGLPPSYPPTPYYTPPATPTHLHKHVVVQGAGWELVLVPQDDRDPGLRLDRTHRTQSRTLLRPADQHLDLRPGGGGGRRQLGAASNAAFCRADHAMEVDRTGRSPPLWPANREVGKHGGSEGGSDASATVRSVGRGGWGEGRAQAARSPAAPAPLAPSPASAPAARSRTEPAAAGGRGGQASSSSGHQREKEGEGMESGQAESQLQQRREAG